MSDISKLDKPLSINKKKASKLKFSRTYVSLTILFSISILFFILFTFNILPVAKLSFLAPLIYSAFIVVQFFDIIAIFLLAYNFVIGLFGLYNNDKKTNYTNIKQFNKFVLVICAHNEENVIKNSLLEMEKIDYPIDKLHLVVVCDNCSDSTFEISKKIRLKYNKPLSGSLVPRMGYKFKMHVLKRVNNIQKGKPYAVKYALDFINEYIPDFDAVSIADADNVYHKDFFNEMNKKLLEGKEIVQGYLGVKNPYDSYICSSNMLAYSAGARSYFTARENLNMSSALGGTGFVLTKNIIKKIPWNLTSLVEDFEYSVKAVLSGYKVNFAYFAKTYDEKPLGLKTSMQQRKRWMQGHWFVCFTNIVPLTKKFFSINLSSMFSLKAPLVNQTLQSSFIPNSVFSKRFVNYLSNKLTQLDYLIYLLSPGRMFVQIWFIISFLLLFPFSVIFPQYSSYFKVDTVLKVVVFFLPIAQSYYFAVLEGFKWNKIVDVFYYYLVYSLSYLPITVRAAFHWREQSVWVKTLHTKTVDVSTLN